MFDEEPLSSLFTIDERVETDSLLANTESEGEGSSLDFHGCNDDDNGGNGGKGSCSIGDSVPFKLLASEEPDHADGTFVSRKVAHGAHESMLPHASPSLTGRGGFPLDSGLLALGDGVVQSKIEHPSARHEDLGSRVEPNMSTCSTARFCCPGLDTEATVPLSNTNRLDDTGPNAKATLSSHSTNQLFRNDTGRNREANLQPRDTPRINTSNRNAKVLVSPRQFVAPHRRNDSIRNAKAVTSHRKLNRQCSPGLLGQDQDSIRGIEQSFYDDETSPPPPPPLEMTTLERQRLRATAHVPGAFHTSPDGQQNRRKGRLTATPENFQTPTYEPNRPWRRSNILLGARAIGSGMVTSTRGAMASTRSMLSAATWESMNGSIQFLEDLRKARMDRLGWALIAIVFLTIIIIGAVLGSRDGLFQGKKPTDPGLYYHSWIQIYNDCAQYQALNMSRISDITLHNYNKILASLELEEFNLVPTVTEVEDCVSDRNVALLSMALSHSESTDQSKLRELYALSVFFLALGGPNWKDNKNWLSFSKGACGWHGAECHNERLVGLSLASNGLSGIVPNEIGLMTNLRTFDLKKNRQVKGTLTPYFSFLTELRDFDLEETMVEGQLLGSLFPLKLTSLRITSDKIEGTLPTELGLLKSLRELFLGLPSLHSTIPIELSQLTSLRVLNVFASFEGEVPPDIWNITSLSAVEIESFRSLEVALPPDLFSRANLTALRFRTSVVKGEIPKPSTGADCANLKRLQMETCGFSGTIPSELGLCTASLSILSFRENNLKGTVPSELGLLEKLTFLSLEDNTLTGTIPTELAQLTNLQEIELEAQGPQIGACNSGFVGTIPSGICDFATVRVRCGTCLAESCPPGCCVCDQL